MTGEKNHERKMLSRTGKRENGTEGEERRRERQDDTQILGTSRDRLLTRRRRNSRSTALWGTLNKEVFFSFFCWSEVLWNSERHAA